MWLSNDFRYAIKMTLYSVWQRLSSKTDEISNYLLVNKIST